MKKILGVSAALVLIATSCVIDRIAGTTDETDTSISGKVSYAGGNSASQAMVSIFKDTATTPLVKVTADNAGNYKFSKLDSGQYSVWAEGNDSIVAYADSIYVPKQKQVIQNLTLEKSGSITAFIKLQLNHDPRTVTVNALGTQKYDNVDTARSFTIQGLAPGEYTLRLVSTIPNYTPTFKTVTIVSGKNDTLKDSIELIYTGIPVVTGIKATFDTGTGIVTLSWNKTGYRDFQDYLIFRDLYDETTLSAQAIAWRKDTLFNDSLSAKDFFSSADTSSLRLKYRVAIRNNAGDAGIAYRYADVWVVPPSLLKVRFDINYIDSTSDTISLVGKFFSPMGTLVKSAQWKDLDNGAVVSSRTFVKQETVAYDTIRYVPKSGRLFLECSVYDTRDQLWKDTVTRYMAFIPVITVQPRDTTVTPFNAARLVVVAIGTKPRTYSWYKNSIDIAHKLLDQAGDTLALWVRLSDNGSYYCVVSNQYGSDTSRAAHITVIGGMPMAVASWTFDSVAGTYYDVTGHGDTLLATGTGLAVTAGVKGLALNCPGAGYELTAKNTQIDFNCNKFSFECWYNSTIDPKTQITNAAQLLCYQQNVVSGERNGYAVYINTSGKVVFGMSTKDGSAYVNAVSTTGLSAQQWYHIVATYDSIALKVYVNGAVENSAQNGSGGYPAPGADARIGCQRLDAGTVWQFLNGKIDEIKYYNYALPSDSVLAHYKEINP